MKRRIFCLCGLGFPRERDLDEHIFRAALAACITDWRATTPTHGSDD